VWVWILHSANWAVDKDKPLLVIGRPLHPGELFTTLQEIADWTGVSKMQVSRILRQFEKAKMILIHTVKIGCNQVTREVTPRVTDEVTQGTLVTVCNWPEYQASTEKDVTPEVTPHVRNQVTSNKKFCNKKNKESSSYYDPRKPPSQLDYYSPEEKLNVYREYDKITCQEIDGKIRNTNVKMMLSTLGLEKTLLACQIISKELEKKKQQRLNAAETKDLFKLAEFMLGKKNSQQGNTESSNEVLIP